MKITITQTGTNDNGFTAKIQFDHGPDYPIAIHNPFSEEQEERLGWYFEEWIAFPFTGDVKANQVATSITDYGHHLFEQLFQGKALREYGIAIDKYGLADLEFEIRGDPSFHSLHWEALKDPDFDLPCAIEVTYVRPNTKPAPVYIKPKPSPTLNILLITARPQGHRDVGYRTISRPLVNALRNAHIRARIDLVRPGTFAALLHHLEGSRNDPDRGDGYYHIIHFDLHGSLLTYDQFNKMEPDQLSNHLLHNYGQPDLEPYEGYKAFLAFNSPQPGQVDMVNDEAIAGLLARHRIPIAILNACQSGKQVGETETSLGSRLMAAGVQTSLAMGYSVSVTAAERLMTHLYTHLLAGLPLAQAICRARLELYNDKSRRAAYNQTIALEDWLLPVVYQNRTSQLLITPFANPDDEKNYWEDQSRRYRAPNLPYGFVGRDLDILEIENRLLSTMDPISANILLVQGMGGTGKTTLFHHLMEWWQTTRLVDQVFYFGYDQKAYTTAEIIDTLALELYGAEFNHNFSSLPDAAKVTKLTARLRSERHLLVLDNLESITGTSLSIQHTLNEIEQVRLREFVDGLAGGLSLVLLGSRGKEEWLIGQFDRSPYELLGLDAGAASSLAERILKRLGKDNLLTVLEHAEVLRQLMKILEGHPLALQVILRNLRQQTPAELLTVFTSGGTGLDVDTGSELWQDKTVSILRCVEYSYSNLSPGAQSLLACLAPFTGVMDKDFPDLFLYTWYLKQQPGLSHLPFDQWGTVLTEAQNWGLLTSHEVERDYFRLHPLLTYFLRQRLSEESSLSQPKKEIKAAIENAFLALYEEMGKSLVYWLTSKQSEDRNLGQSRVGLEYENLHTALKLILAKHRSFELIYDSLLYYLRMQENHQKEKELSELILASQNHYPIEQMQGETGGNFLRVHIGLGTANLQLNHYEEAADAYRNALQMLPQLTDIPDEQRNQWKMTIHHNLGVVARDKKNWSVAENHYQQTLNMAIQFNDRQGQAYTYGELGNVLGQQDDWIKAEEYYQQALAIFIESKDRQNQSKIYYHLGMGARKQRDWGKAKKYINQAIDIFIEFNDYNAQMGAYRELGTIALDQSDLSEAEKAYQKALIIAVKIGDYHSQATTYYQFGRIAQAQKEHLVAKSHYEKALTIFSELNVNDRYSQATVHHQLGVLAQDQEDWVTARDHYKKALAIWSEFNDRYNPAKTHSKLGMIAQHQREWVMATKHYQEALAIEIEFNDRFGQATTYGQLGLLAEVQEKYHEELDCLLQALDIFDSLDHERGSAIVTLHLAKMWHAGHAPTLPARLADLWDMREELTVTLLQQLTKKLNQP